MAMATAGGLLLLRLHHMPASTSACTSSTATSSPHSAFTCTLPCSSWGAACSLTSFGELRTTRQVGALRATGSEVAAPAPVEEKGGPHLPCDKCNSKGWLVCGFCKGQKTNVQVRANKFYRRCPSCRAVGVVICPQCKVFKCVTFPDSVDGY